MESARNRACSKIALRCWRSITTVTAPITAICSATMIIINLARRLPRMNCSTRRGRAARRDRWACHSPVAWTIRRDVKKSLPTWLDMGRGRRCILCGVSLEPDPLQWDGALAQEADFHPLDIGLIQVFKHIKIVLGNPWGIVHNDAFHLSVQCDPLRIMYLPPGLLQQLIYQQIAVECVI